MKTEMNNKSEIIGKNIFSNKEATIRIKIKKALERNEEIRIKNLSKKPQTIEQKIIENYSKK